MKSLNDYNNSVASFLGSASKFGPDLTDMQTALSNDLTAKCLNATRGVFAKANTDHAGPEKDSDMASKHLSAALAPIAGGDQRFRAVRGFF